METMVKQSKKLLADMEEAAKSATYQALLAYLPPDPEENVKLALGKIYTNSEAIFELNVPGERPQDAKVISRATVNRVSGKMVVEVFLKRRPS